MKTSIPMYLVSFLAFMGLMVGVTFLRAWQVNGPENPEGAMETLVDGPDPVWLQPIGTHHYLLVQPQGIGLPYRVIKM